MAARSSDSTAWLLSNKVFPVDPILVGQGHQHGDGQAALVLSSIFTGGADAKRGRHIRLCLIAAAALPQLAADKCFFHADAPAVMFWL